MREGIVIAVIAFVFYGGYLWGRRMTEQEMRILELYQEQLERIEQIGRDV